MVAAMALGAEGVQIGSRFAACVEESSAHDSFKAGHSKCERGRYQAHAKGHRSCAFVAK